MRRCPDCEMELPDDAGTCPGCGTGLHRCARCGSEYAEGEACPACGAIRVPAACDDHPDQQAVGLCVVCGRTVCGACGADDRRRRPHLCDEHRGITLIEGWAQVYTTTGEFEAQLVRDNLHAEGIDAQILSQRDNIFAVEVGELSIVRILVPVWQYAHAQAVIRDHMDAEGEVAFACPSCGEAYEAGSRECAACGAVLA